MQVSRLVRLVVSFALLDDLGHVAKVTVHVVGSLQATVGKLHVVGSLYVVAVAGLLVAVVVDEVVVLYEPVQNFKYRNRIYGLINRENKKAQNISNYQSIILFIYQSNYIHTHTHTFLNSQTKGRRETAQFHPTFSSLLGLHFPASSSQGARRHSWFISGTRADPVSAPAASLRELEIA